MTQITVSVAASGDDGRVRRTGTAYPPTTANGVTMVATELDPRKQFATPNYNSYVCAVRFDTSAIPDDATITAATLRMVAATGMVNPDTRNLNFEWYTWSSPLVDGDYADDVGTTANATALSALTIPGTNDFTLSNPDANILKTGFTGIRFGISGGAPTGLNEVFFRSWDHATLAEPQLIVDYDEVPEDMGSASVAWLTA